MRLAHKFKAFITHKRAGQQTRFSQDLKTVTKASNRQAFASFFNKVSHNRAAGSNREAAIAIVLRAWQLAESLDSAKQRQQVAAALVALYEEDGNQAEAEIWRQRAGQ